MCDDGDKKSSHVVGLCCKKSRFVWSGQTIHFETTSRIGYCHAIVLDDIVNVHTMCSGGVEYER